MLKHRVQKYRDFMPKTLCSNQYYRCCAQSAETLMYAQRQKRSKVQNMVIHRAQDNSWTTDNFRSIVLYDWPLWWNIWYLVKFDWNSLSSYVL